MRTTGMMRDVHNVTRLIHNFKSRVDLSTQLYDPGRLEYLGTGRVGSSHTLAKSGRVGPRLRVRVDPRREA